MFLFKSNENNIFKKILPIKYLALSIMIVWTFIASSLLVWNISTEKKGTLENAKIEARTLIRKDILYREWNSMHGGVYVPVIKDTVPNKYLNILERDVETTSGTKLTMINPSYMTRQVHEIENKRDGVKGHLTSLNPIRPENLPDAWEEKALKLFHKGKKEESSMEVIHNKVYLKLMATLIAEKRCLKCHAAQGYKEGDIRGGLSVSIPLLPHKNIERQQIQTLYITYSLFWFVGATGITTGFFFLIKKIKNQITNEIKIKDQERLQGVLEMAGAVCHELNQPFQAVLSASEIIQIKIEHEESISEEVSILIDELKKMGTITENLMNITKYKTKKYLNGSIIDIDEASNYNTHKKLKGKNK
ncbi:MAG: DUF3365 domain-containing protein [Deltaproteobacteria bacterium]|nr:DUF3365 domain-containing protein [Deltaproteobacteria bacterium]